MHKKVFTALFDILIFYCSCFLYLRRYNGTKRHAT